MPDKKEVLFTLSAAQIQVVQNLVREHRFNGSGPNHKIDGHRYKKQKHQHFDLYGLQKEEPAISETEAARLWAMGIDPSETRRNPDAKRAIPEFKESTLENLLHPVTGKPVRVGFVAVATSEYGSNMDAIFDSICQITRLGNHDIVLAPEYSFLPASGPLNIDEKNKYIDQLKDVSRNGTLIIPGTIVWEQDLIMRNTAFVFYNGEVIHEYDKSTNGNQMISGGDKAIANYHGFAMKFGKEPGVFSWEGLKAGVEICSDAGILFEKYETDALDLALLVSCGNKKLGKTMKALHQEGYGIVLDGDQLSKGVGKKWKGDCVHNQWTGVDPFFVSVSYACLDYASPIPAMPMSQTLQKTK